MFKMKSRITLPCCGWHVFIQMLTLSLLDARLNTRKILGNQTAGYYQNWRYRATSQLSMWTSHWEGQYCQPCHGLLGLFVLRCFFSVCLPDLLFIFRPRPARWQWRLVMALLDWRLKLAKLWPHHSLKRRSGSDFYEIKQKLFSRIRIQLVGPASQYWTLRWRQMYKYFSKNKTLSLKVWSVGSCGKKIRISAIKRRHRGGMWDVKM